MYTMIMSSINKTIVEQCNRCLTADAAYKVQDLQYLRSIMKIEEQEILIATLDTLNYYQLKMCLAAGVPGHAQIRALQLAKEHRDRLDAAVIQGGTTAVMETEVETEPEEGKDDDEGVCTSESGREGDSETLDDASTNSG